MRRALIGAAGVVAGAVAVFAGHVTTPDVVGEPWRAVDPGGRTPSYVPAPSRTPRRLVDGSATGREITTLYGSVQVEVTVKAGKIVDVKALILPMVHERSRWIDANLIPRLRQRVLTAQSENVDVMSGATSTSEGYLRSLQAALDQLT